MIEFKVDLSQFNAAIQDVSKLKATIRDKVMGPQLAAQAKVYTVREMDAALKANGDIQEGQVRMVRGQHWRGWRLKAVKKYGTTVYQSTRYYFRKFARSAENLKKKQGATFAKGERNKRWGKGDHVIERGDQPRNYGQEFHVRARPFEKVWAKRSKRSRYSASSKLMADTGDLRKAIIGMQTRITRGAGANIEFSPGTQARHFEYQNKMRRIWTWYLPKDSDKIRDLLQAMIDKAVNP